ncbi:MAG: type I-C CRISPR-associated endonuclease Cas1c [bacterium]|nr:type I-C CRISPR-associated endonuclease Cas1c [bacterium]
MRKLLNSLFVTTESAYALLENDNIVLKNGDELIGSYPLHILEEIYLFSYAGASPALIGRCADMGINLVFLKPNGKFLARISGTNRGNVLLRRQQYRWADDEEASCRVARNFIFGKLSNARHVLNRCRRDHADRVNVLDFQNTAEKLAELQKQVLSATNLDALRGFEGAGATLYFGLFSQMILDKSKSFVFLDRNRRPPLDRVNAMLSFTYALLASSCASALEMVGLDSYVGFLHRDRPGRTSLALDLMEELRPCMADRFVLTLINNRIIGVKDFYEQENGAVWLDEKGRKKLLKIWQEQKRNIIEHSFTKEKIAWGLIPYVQALLLARYLRGDLDGYPPFIWRG